MSVSQKVVSDICHTLLKYCWIFVIFLHQSRFCEAFSRRHHPLSQMAVKRIVKKCRHCFCAQTSAGRPGVGKRDVFLSVVQVAVCMSF